MNKLDRELALVKVEATGAAQDRALDVVGQWSGRLLKLSTDQFVVELAGSPKDVNQFLTEIGSFGQVLAMRSETLSL